LPIFGGKNKLFEFGAIYINDMCAVFGGSLAGFPPEKELE
jgi:hypothetical protein